MTFGTRLHAERKRLNLTQAEAAERGGVVRLSYHGYENDVRLPNVDFLIKLKEAGFDIHYLLFDEHEPNLGPPDQPLTPAVLSSIYRAVDEFAINDAGDALPVQERVRLFEFLCQEVTGTVGRVAPAELRRRLARYNG